MDIWSCPEKKLAENLIEIPCFEKKRYIYGQRNTLCDDNGCFRADKKRKNRNEKAYPSAVGMPFVICGYIRKICEYFSAGTPNSALFSGQRLILVRFPHPAFTPSHTNL